MDRTKHSAFCLDLLNEIHANRAIRHLNGTKQFSTRELIAICTMVGDKPTWDRDAQPKLIADTLDVMALRDPYIETD